jgi:hypothetical protein
MDENKNVFQIEELETRLEMGIISSCECTCKCTIPEA